MALFDGNIRSHVLGMDTRVQVILPWDRPAAQQKKPCPVLYLLHGLGGNSQAWCRHTTVERQARQHGIAIVMPEVQRSFYVDMAYGNAYLTYVAEELPRLCTDMFRISTRREDTFVAGLSMGGYGALHCAFSYPERYGAAASFSGALDARGAVEEFAPPEMQREMIGVLGEAGQIREENDLFRQAESLLERDMVPRVLITCGEQDYLFPMNCRFRDHLTALDFPFRFRSWDGSHEWDFWERSISVALEFFSEKN